MESGFGARHSKTSLVRCAGRRVTTVGSAMCALALLTLGTAPAASTADVRSKQWYLEAMSAEKLWTVSTGEGIKVAVVDSGVRVTSSLKGRVLPGTDATGEAGGAEDDYDGHGTTMAELIAGSGHGGGLKGLAPGAEIVPIRTTTGKEPGKKLGDTPAAIRAAADSDARIINMSFGSDFMSQAERAAVKYAAGRGKLLFAGVGNDAQTKNFVGYPAAYPEVVGVSAADRSGKVAKFSEYGEYVDLAAPGLDIPRWCDETFRSYCDEGGGGTSAATAIASASAALVWSKHPDWTANQVLRVLIDTAGRDWPKDEPSDYLGYGLIRPARNVVKGEGEPGPADTDPITNEKTAGGGGGSDSGDSTSPTSTSPTSTPSRPDEGATSGGKETAAAEASNDGGSNLLWPVLGGLTAVVVIGGGVFAAMRARRRA
ncbi:serine protease [Streptomyces sp. NRRL S-1521]|nr:serine protease [Streptomyces sp. NRRL S-1521]